MYNCIYIFVLSNTSPEHPDAQNAVLAGRGEQAATQRELHTPDGALVVAAQVAVSNTSEVGGKL